MAEISPSRNPDPAALEGLSGFKWTHFFRVGADVRQHEVAFSGGRASGRHSVKIKAYPNLKEEGGPHIYSSLERRDPSLHEPVKEWPSLEDNS